MTKPRLAAAPKNNSPFIVKYWTQIVVFGRGQKSGRGGQNVASPAGARASWRCGGPPPFMRRKPAVKKRQRAAAVQNLAEISSACPNGGWRVKAGRGLLRAACPKQNGAKQALRAVLL